MRFSVFIPVPKDFVSREYTVYEAVYNAVRGADEVVLILDQPSETEYSLIDQAAQGYTQKLAMYENPWRESFEPMMYPLQYNLGLAHCQMPWAWRHDADEVVALEVYDEVRMALLKTGDMFDSFSLGTTHFYGDYDHFRLTDPFQGHEWYNHKIRLIRRDSGFFFDCTENEIDELVHLSSRRSHQATPPRFGKISRRIHHYGHVRSQKVYCTKANSLEKAHGSQFQLSADVGCVEEGTYTYTNTHPEIMRGRIQCGTDHLRILQYYQQLYMKGRDNK